jgi:hypothetical protein
MKNSTLLVLLLLAGLAILGAVLAVQSNRSALSPAQSVAPGTRVLPDLGGKVSNVAKIQVASRGTTIDVVKDGDTWRLPARAGYPVPPARVAEVLNALAELRKAEPRTSRPDSYERLGVQDPPQTPPSPLPASITPIGVTLFDASGTSIAGLIIGNSAQVANRSGVFVRLPGEAQSWLAEGRADVRTEPNGWLETQILGITRDRLRQITVNHPAAGDQPAETLVVSRETREAPTFAIAGVPAGRELSSPNAPDALSNAIAWLSFEDVAKALSVDFSGAGGKAVAGPTTEFRTFDGLVVSVQSAVQDGRTFLGIRASIDETSLPPAPPAPPAAEGQPAPPPPANAAADAVRKEAADLNTKLGEWAYVISSERAKTLGTRLADLLKPATTDAPTAAPAP